MTCQYRSWVSAALIDKVAPPIAAALGLARSRVCAWRGLEISAGHLEAEKSFPAFLEI
jgi:hypothetical protein